MPQGTVKFFNEAKGFGFIAPDDGGGDVFVHISAVERAGLSRLAEGDQVAFEVEHDRRSGKPAAVDLQVTGSAPASSSRGGRPGFGGRPSGDRDRGSFGRRPGGERSDGEPVGAGSGVVKWFNTTKGFGFIQPHDGGADVFVHISAVERAGLSRLDEGQPLFYELAQDRRTGKASAINLRLG